MPRNRQPRPWHPNHGFVNLKFVPHKALDGSDKVAVVFESGVYHWVLASDIQNH